MSDRRDPMYPQNSVYPSGQWNGGGQQYSSSTISYSPTSYPPSPNHVASAPQVVSPYGTLDARGGASSYQGAYYAVAPSYSQSGSASTPAHQQPNYATMNASISPVQPPRHPHLQSPPQSHVHHHSYSQSHSQPQVQAQSPSYPPQTRPRSHSQAHPYMTPPSSSQIMGPHQSTTHYPTPIPLSQAISISPQYPASPSRPFSCDMCALSFNRQHDLKRHRETHTGEKPYLCNGGCGKTFTRKDALKRHQLVKGCGKIDDAWP